MPQCAAEHAQRTDDSVRKLALADAKKRNARNVDPRLRESHGHLLALDTMTPFLVKLPAAVTSAAEL